MALFLPVQSVRRKISDLQTIERTLLDMSRDCDRRVDPECPILSALMEEENLKFGAQMMTPDQ